MKLKKLGTWFRAFFLYVCKHFLVVACAVLLKPFCKLQVPGALVDFVVARLAQRRQVPYVKLVLRVEAPVQDMVDNNLLTASTQDAAALLLDMLASELFPFFSSQELHCLSSLELIYCCQVFCLQTGHLLKQLVHKHLLKALSLYLLLSHSHNLVDYVQVCASEQV